MAQTVIIDCRNVALRNRQGKTSNKIKQLSMLLSSELISRRRTMQIAPRVKKDTHLTAAEKITKSRSWLILHKPFWGVLCLKPKIVISENQESGWTDGRRVGYNPSWVDTLSLRETISFMAHETGGHIGFGHHLRVQKRNRTVYNMAADYVIDMILEKDGFTPIQGYWLSDYRFDNMTSEAVYEILMKETKEKIKKAIADGKEGEGILGGDNQHGNIGTSMDMTDLLDEQDKKDLKDLLGDKEIDASNFFPNKGCGEVREMKGKDGKTLKGAEKAEAEMERKISISQAASAARAAGKLPGNIERLIDETIKATVDWKTQLRHFIGETIRNDYTWARPNRRYAASGLYMPSLYGDDVLKIAVAIDTSGSVRSEELSQFTAELNMIRNEFKCEVTRLYCDTQIHNPRVFEPDEELEFEARGFGGTDFRPPFRWIEKNRDEPLSGMIYFTDGYCWSFPEEPEYPVMWALTSEMEFNATFGDVVKIDLDS
jgi:predicted metal-dependent peptidase